VWVAALFRLGEGESSAFLSMLKGGGSASGGSYGRGAMVSAAPDSEYDGPWGAPAMYALDGGSRRVPAWWAVPPICVQLVRNQRGVTALLNNKVKLGGQAPPPPQDRQGRGRSAPRPNATLRAEILR
jgi:hypothetical protein